MCITICLAFIAGGTSVGSETLVKLLVLFIIPLPFGLKGLSDGISSLSKELSIPFAGFVSIIFSYPNKPLVIAALPSVPIKPPIAVPAAELDAIAAASLCASALSSAIAILLSLSN